MVEDLGIRGMFRFAPWKGARADAKNLAPLRGAFRIRIADPRSSTVGLLAVIHSGVTTRVSPCPLFGRLEACGPRGDDTLLELVKPEHGGLVVSHQAYIRFLGNGKV